MIRFGRIIVFCTFLDLSVWGGRAATNTTSSVPAIPPTEAPDTLIWWLVLGGLCFFAGMLQYVFIWLKHRECLRSFRFFSRCVHLIAHVPDDESSPWPHVTAGVLTCSGICLLVGSLTAIPSIVANRYDAHGTTLTAAGLIFGILIAVISFWTLWQTKRIEHLQGANIDGFRMLTVSITESIEKLTENFEKHGKKASSHHKIFFVTTNPHFGGLSFPLTSASIFNERTEG